MNRRSFFQIVAGVIAGLFIPKIAKPKGLTVTDIVKCRDELKDKKIPSVITNCGVEFIPEQYDYVIYEIDSKTRTVIKNDEIVSRATLEQCPYAWFGKIKEGIEFGSVSFVMWKLYRPNCISE